MTTYLLSVRLESLFGLQNYGLVPQLLRRIPKSRTVAGVLFDEQLIVDFSCHRGSVVWSAFVTFYTKSVSDK